MLSKTVILAKYGDTVLITKVVSQGILRKKHVSFQASPETTHRL